MQSSFALLSNDPKLSKNSHENKADLIFHDVLKNFYALDQFKEMYYTGEIDFSCFVEYLPEGISCAQRNLMKIV